MVLEATVVCLDNSDYMRNGDYTPTRLEAQHDAVNLICGAKTESNPENTVAAVACAGRSPDVLVTLTGDLGKLLSALHSVKVSGQLNFTAGIQVAQLVLKHRQNKNQHQRIIFFVGSPITSTSDELVRLAKRLKKNNVAVDIVNFGEQEDNTEKLEAFINAVNSNDNSHLVNIPPGPHILSDIILSSPIITGEAGGAAGGVPAATGGGSTAANDFAMYGGIDPNLDPELALVMKISLEEARAKQESEKPKTEEGAKPEQTTATTGASTTATTATTQETEMPDAEMDDELSAALAMSMAVNLLSQLNHKLQHQLKRPQLQLPLLLSRKRQWKIQMMQKWLWLCKCQ